MLIRSITVENFLPFQGKQTIRFSTNPDQNVTLIMGNNGAGKTSLAQAFEWCLYGHEPKDSTRVINAFVRDHIVPGSYRNVSVEIEIDKNGTVFIVSRSQRYSRHESGRLDRPGQHEFVVSYKEDGQIKQVAATDRQATINTLLSSQLSHYFFFDGEHVKNMRAELERGKSSDFADAVKVILGLQPIASALDHLKAPGTRMSVERWFNKQFDLTGNQDLEEKSRRIGGLEKKIKDLTEEMKFAEVDEQASMERVEKYQELLRENQESEKAQRNVDEATRAQQQAKERCESQRDAFFKLFRTQHFRFFTERMILNAREELADEDKISKGVPSVDNKTISFILERGECLCGTKFSIGDEIFQHLNALYEYVPPKDLGTYISEFDKECRVRTEGPLTFYKDLVDAYRQYGNADNAVIEADHALSNAKSYLAGINRVDVRNLRNNLKESEQDRSRAAGRAQVYRRDISSAKNEIEQLRIDIQSYSVKNTRNREITECLKYVEYIYTFLSNFYSKHELIVREQLKETVNKFFTRMYDGELHLELDENYGVSVVVDNISTTDESWKTSSGQTLAIILAFILGILDIAKDSNDEDSGLLKGDTYPLVMDAPLSDFDKTRIGTICNLLPAVAEQIIIIIKDTDGDLAEQHMRNYIGRRYTIERISDYESVVKECGHGGHL